jgi:RNA polymerase II subunit A small phosphatase-like protein
MHIFRRPKYIPAKFRNYSQSAAGARSKSLASAPDTVTATFDRSVRSCRRLLLEIFAVLGSPRKRRAAAAAFQRPPATPPRPTSHNPAVRAQFPLLPPSLSPGRPTLSSSMTTPMPTPCSRRTPSRWRHSWATTTTESCSG